MGEGTMAQKSPTLAQDGAPRHAVPLKEDGAMAHHGGRRKAALPWRTMALIIRLKGNGAGCVFQRFRRPRGRPA
jgi:hypothetical protein